MYKVIGISSGIVMASFLNKGNAMQWIEVNGYDEEGNNLHLYRIVKE